MAVRIECHNGYFGQVYTSANGAEFAIRGQDFNLVDIAVDVDTDEIYYTVECERLGQPIQFVIPKKHAINKKKLLEYADMGLDVNDGNSAIVAEVFSIKEGEYVDAKKPISTAHSVAGVKEVITGDKRSFVYVGFHNPLEKSKYVGHLNLEPKGDKNAWFAFVKAEMVGSVETQFTVSLSFSAIIHGALKDMIDVENFVVHYRGDSSSGKTTELCLGASVFGAGTVDDERGIISTWNATKNAILRRLMRTSGMLMGLDEISMNREKDFTGLLYSISSGVEKDRLTREAQVQSRLTGRYLLMSTGEASLLAKTNGNIGLSLRVLEFDSHQWTSSAEQAERIKCFCKNNYGHAATEFGLHLYQLILDKGIDYVYGNFKYWREFYCKRCTIQARKERMSGRYALILLGAQYANRFFDMKINIPALCDFIIQNENDGGDDRDYYGGVYDKLIAYIIMNQRYFDMEKKDGSRVVGGMREVRPDQMRMVETLEPWGVIKNLVHGHKLYTGEYAYKTVAITEVAFNRIVGKELGYEDPKAIRKYLKNKGLLRCEKDRDIIRKTFRGVRTNMVEIYMPSAEEQNEEEQVLVAKARIKERLNQLDNMLELSFAERNKAFRELESLKGFMTKTQEKQYQSLLKDRENFKSINMLLDEEE